MIYIKRRLSRKIKKIVDDFPVTVLTGVHLEWLHPKVIAVPWWWMDT